MRLLILPLALVISGQAYAQNRAEPRSVTVEQVGDALSNPTVQAGIAGLVGVFADTVLDTRIDPVAHYTDRVRPGDTLGDMVRREDPRFDEKLQNGTRRAVALAGQLTRDGAAMGTEIGKTADKLQALLEGTATLVKAYSRGN
ncbi:MAG: hypothetical protein KF730_16165 [Sphingomonas sp.]|uniref:hypothetical protein n=1 Tax=Sphingomonas sp. TaxID=28214 RepID=UPI0025FBF0F8|nr:hypothetical protein [Sphingomonas sp.]MBX3566096.1 hypothetical protein [Sphingomonas sp.]